MRVIAKDSQLNDNRTGCRSILPGQAVRLMAPWMAKRWQEYSGRPWRSGLKEVA